MEETDRNQTHSAQCLFCGCLQYNPVKTNPEKRDEEKFHYVACTNCGLIYLFPSPPEAFPPSDKTTTETHPDFEAISRFLPKPKQSGAFLDFGCLDNRLISIAIESGYQYTGVLFPGQDPPAPGSRNENISFLSLGEILKKSPEQSFNIIYIGDVLTSANEPAIFFNTIKRLLTKNGILILDIKLEQNFSVAKFFRYVCRIFTGFTKQPAPQGYAAFFRANFVNQFNFLKNIGIYPFSYKIYEPVYPSANITSVNRFFCYIGQQAAFLLSFANISWGSRAIYFNQLDTTKVLNIKKFKLFRRNQGITLFLFLVLLSLSSIQWIIKTKDEPRDTHFHERYNPALNRLKSIHHLILYTDSMAATREINTDSISEQYANLLHEVIKDCFYAAPAEWNMSNDYIAYMIDKLIIDGFADITNPDQIMRKHKGTPAQQSIVLQEALQRKGYITRTVFLQNHIASEVNYNNTWHFFDTNKEPNLMELVSTRPSTAELINNPALIIKAYEGTAWIDENTWSYYFDKTKLDYSAINIYPGRSLHSIHIFTRFLSNFAWIFFFLNIVRVGIKHRHSSMQKLKSPIPA